VRPRSADGRALPRAPPRGMRSRSASPAATAGAPRHAEPVGDAFSASAIDTTGVDVTAPRASRSASRGRDSAAVATSDGRAVVALLASTTSALVSRGTDAVHSSVVQPNIHQLYPGPPPEGASSSSDASDQEDAISEPARPASRAIETGRPRGRVKQRKGSLPTALREELGRECSFVHHLKGKARWGSSATRWSRIYSKKKPTIESRLAMLHHEDEVPLLASCSFIKMHAFAFTVQLRCTVVTYS